MQINKLHRIAATLAACCAGLLAGASAASATPAVWTGISGLTDTYVNTSPPMWGTFTIKVGVFPTPQTTFTCLGFPQSKQSGYVSNAATPPSTPLTGYYSGFRFDYLDCQNGLGGYALIGLLGTYRAMHAEKTGTAYSLIGQLSHYVSIWSADGGVTYTGAAGQPAAYTAAWSNSASTVTFTDAVIGKVDPGKPLAGQPIKLTGTFTMKTSSGGNFQLS